MRLRFILVAVVVVLALAVPTMAMTTNDPGGDGSETLADRIDISPSDGPNGQYATVEDDEIRIDFEGLNDRARTTAHDVFELTSHADDDVEVWVQSDDAAVTAYAGDNPDRTMASDDRVRLAPGDTLSVGFHLDTHGETPQDVTISIGLRYEDEDDPTDDPETGPQTPTATPTPTPDDTEETEFRDDATGVEVTFGDDVDPENVTVEELTEQPADGPEAPPRAVIDRGSRLSGIADDGISVFGDRQVAMQGETVRLTGTTSTVYGAPGLSKNPQALSIVRIVPPEEVRERPATVRLSVDRSRFGDSDPAAARIGRHTPDGWQVLQTRVVEETDNRVVLEARTTGFSTFAVFADVDVTYEWTLPDGTTVAGENLETQFDETGVYNVTLTVTDAEGRTDAAQRQLFINDEPSVSIEGADNVTEDAETTLVANVTNEIGNTTVTWTLPGGETVSGEQVTGEFSSGDSVSVTVEDQFGATGSAETTLTAAAVAEPGPAPGLQTLPLGISVWMQLFSALISVSIAVVAIRSEAPKKIRRGVMRIIEAGITDDSPRVVTAEGLQWNPEENCFEIGTFEVYAPSGLLRTVEITVTDGTGNLEVTKTIDVDAPRSYSSTMERIPVYGDDVPPEDGDFDIRIRAVDEHEHAGILEWTREAVEGPTTTSS